MANERILVGRGPSKKRRLNQQTRYDFQDSPSSELKLTMHGLLQSERRYQAMEADVLVELGRALDELCSHRQKQQTQGDNGIDAGLSSIGKSPIDYIPGLVNRVIIESSDIRGCRRTPSVTKMLVQIILTFVEPYLIETAAQSLSARTQQQQQKQQQHQTPATDAPKKSDSNGESKLANNTKKDKFRERAVKWAMERLKDLLRPSVETDIPELDALLSATGPHDGLEHEARVQKVLFSSIEMMENEILRNRNDDKDCEEVQQFLAERRSKLENVQFECLGCEFQKDSNALQLAKGSKTKEEVWSLFPDQWLTELQARSNDNITIQQEGSGSDDTYDEALSAFPFLGQMKDFLERHEKDDCIINS